MVELQIEALGESHQRSPIENRQSNIPLFIAFRVLFNARWYYPVLAVLFQDFGLSIAQYAMLNVVWAAAIVGFEIPLGALADQIGRKKMVVLASSLMVVELALFAFAPLGNPSLAFWFFALNRLLSGAAEASANGADEALAYESLEPDQRAYEWPRVLESQMRWQSAGFFIAMMIGAVVYSEGAVQTIIHTLGLPWSVTHHTTMRFPIYLTLLNAVLALVVSLKMREAATVTRTASSKAALRDTLVTGLWILRTPLPLAIILGGFVIDNIVRLFMTMVSNYYRLIALPDASFGVIGSGMAVIGFFTPQLARWLVGRNPMRANFAIIAMSVMIGLIGAALALPIYGLIFLVPIGAAISLNQFFVSHYLNATVTDTRLRATVLSFRGLAYNLAYGVVGILYSWLTHALRNRGTPEMVFGQSLRWLPWYFAVTVGMLAIAWARLLKAEHSKVES